MVGLLVLASCSDVAVEAERAHQAGLTINNEIMTAMYPQAFGPGEPPYLERDFEAGADFICDEIKLKYERDICAEPEIGWRD